MPTTTLPSSIPDSQLGLSASELAILRQHQQIALSSAGGSSNTHYANSTASSRGRGHVRSSASTSRAASSAGTHGGGGRLLLDAGSLAVLGSHFERLMGAIQGRVDSVGRRILMLQKIHIAAPSWAFHLSIDTLQSAAYPTFGDSLLMRLFLAHSTNPTLSLLAIRPRPNLHRRRRRRDRPLQRNIETD